MRRRTEIIKGVLLFVGIVAIPGLQTLLMFHFPDKTSEIVGVLFAEAIFMAPGVLIALGAWVVTRIQRRRKGGVLASDSGFLRVMRLVILIGAIGCAYCTAMWVASRDFLFALGLAYIFGAAILAVANVGLLGVLLESRVRKRARPTVSPTTGGIL